MWLQPRITLTSLRRQSEPDAKTLAFSCSTVRVRAVPSVNEKMIKRPQEFKNVLHIKKLATRTQDFIPGSKFDNDQSNLFAWHDEGSERVDPKTDWRWYDTKQSPSSSSEWQPYSSWQSSSWSQRSTCGGAMLFSQSWCFADRQWIPLLETGQNQGCRKSLKSFKVCKDNKEVSHGREQMTWKQTQELASRGRKKRQLCISTQRMQLRLSYAAALHSGSCA